MIFRTLKSLFSSDISKVPTRNDTETQIATLTKISDGLGEYATVALSKKTSKEKNEKALKMLSIIKQIEKTCTQVINSCQSSFC